MTEQSRELQNAGDQPPEVTPAPERFMQKPTEENDENNNKDQLEAILLSGFVSLCGRE